MMNSIRVLLVDDDSVARQGIGTYLQYLAEFDVIECENGAKALRHLKEQAGIYTVVLLEFALGPPVTGNQVLAEIRSLYPRLPVIVFTGKDPHEGVKTLEKGVYRYMRRPLDLVELVNTIRNLAKQDAKWREMAADIRNLLQSDLCIAWQFDKKEGQFRVAAWDGELDKTYRETIFLDAKIMQKRQSIRKGQPIYISDVKNKENAPDYIYREQAQKRGWTTLICVPLVHNKRIIGFIDSYTYQPFKFLFQEYERMIMSSLRAFANQAAESIRNIDLSNRLETLQDINQLLTGTFDEQTIVRQILAKGMELVGGDVGQVYLMDINRSCLVLKESIGIPDELVEHTRELGQALTEYVAQTGVAEHIPDISKDYRHTPIPGVEINSKVAVPLRRQEQMIGVLSVKSRLYNAFTDDDVNLLTALATQAAIAIERARLNRHLQEVSHLALGEDYNALLKYVVNAVRDLTFADVSLWMLGGREEEKGQYLRIVESAGDIGQDYIKNARVPMDSTISINVLALREKRAIIRPDIQNDSEKPQFYHIERVIERDWHGFMAVPLIGQEGEPLGTLSLYSKEIATFGLPEVELMQTFANQVAIALQQQFKNMQIQRQKEAEIKAIGQIATSIAIDAPIGPDEVLRNIMKSMVPLMGRSNLFNVRLLDKKTNELVHIASQGEMAEGSPLRIKVGEGVTGWVAQHKKAQLVRDLRQDERYMPSLVGGRSQLAVPMLKGDELIGVLNIENPEVNAFTESDVQLAEAIAGLAVVALENNQLQEAQGRATAVEKFAVIGHVTAEFVHRMSNLAGTIPVRVNLAKEYLDHNDPKHAKVIKQLNKIGDDTHLLLDAVQKIKRTTKKREPEDVVVSQLLEEALEIVCSSQPQAKGQIEVEREFALDLPVLHLDRRHLLDCLVSVIRNAVQAMPNGGTLSLSTVKSTMRDKACVEIRITDNGVGISAENLPKIFNLFFTTKERGLGYGLWRDKTLIKMLGGDIEAESVEGVGSTFTIKVPVVSFYK